jgi:hypothetical protein
MYAFTNMDFAEWGLRSITIPPNVSSIETQAFTTCENLIRITFEGNLVTTLAGNINFPNDFHSFYNDQTSKAGTYVWGGTSWSKE